MDSGSSSRPFPSPGLDPVAAPPTLPQRWAARLAASGIPDIPTVGPPHVTPSVLRLAQHELDAWATLTPHALLGHSIADHCDAGFLLPDHTGFRTALSALPSDPTEVLRPEAPHLLAGNLSSRTLAQLLAFLTTSAVRCYLTVLGVHRTTHPGAPDCLTLALLAHRLWGHRMVGAARHVVAAGLPFPWAARPGRVQLAALHFFFDGRPARTAHPPFAILHSLPTPLSPDPVLSVCVGASANAEVAHCLDQFARTVRASPLSLDWATTTYQPGNAAAAHGQGTESLVLHVLRLRSPLDLDVIPAHALTALESDLRALPEGVVPTSIWGPVDATTMVHVPIDPGLLPMAYARAFPVATALRGRVGVACDGLLIMHLDDQVYPSFEDALQQAAPGCLPPPDASPAIAPRRPLLYPVAPGPSTHGACRALLRFAAPAEGHHLEWLVRTNGQVPPAQISAALSAVVGPAALAHVRDVYAHDPDTDQYCAMVGLRVLPSSAPVMAAAFLGGGDSVRRGRH